MITHKISKNFKWYEFLESDIAKKNNVNNFTNEEFVLNNIELLVKNILQPVRDKFGRIKITSGYRCYELNKILKSNIWSNHRFGLAADFKSMNNVPLIDIIDWINSNLKYKEMIAEYLPDGWIHIAYQKDRNINELKFKEKYIEYTLTNMKYLKHKYIQQEVY